MGDLGGAAHVAASQQPSGTMHGARLGTSLAAPQRLQARSKMLAGLSGRPTSAPTQPPQLAGASPAPTCPIGGDATVSMIPGEAITLEWAKASGRTSSRCVYPVKQVSQVILGNVTI